MKYKCLTWLERLKVLGMLPVSTCQKSIYAHFSVQITFRSHMKQSRFGIILVSRFVWDKWMVYFYIQQDVAGENITYQREYLF